MRKHLKALSVKLPWAWLMFPELINAPYPKDIENREYVTAWRGTVAIQCSKRINREDIFQAGNLIERRRLGITIPPLQELERYAGKIIGTVDITGCVADSPSSWFVGRYGWVLANPMSLKEPIACRGTISPVLWDVPDFALIEINKQLGSKL